MTEATAEIADESVDEMRLLTHLVGSAARVHGALAQDEIDEILDHTRPSSPEAGGSADRKLTPVDAVAPLSTPPADAVRRDLAISGLVREPTTH